VVQSLGKGGDEELATALSSGAGPELEKAKSPENVEKPSEGSRNECPKKTVGRTIGMIGAFDPNKRSDGDDNKTDGMIKEFGRLVVDEGRSRYVSNKFWTSLSEEVAEMQDILDDPTDDEEDYPSPGSASSASANHQGFIFSFSSTILSLRKFHPPVTQIPVYWNLFKSNIDPVMKLLHIPTMEVRISRVCQDLDSISKPMDALLFTVYFAAVTSLSPEDCIVQLGHEKQAALRKYRFAAEQAFARAGFLSTQELLVLQALLLFLTCVRRQDDTRYVWTLTGLLIRLANALGVHRDGEQFNLSPFETELRRRLWWQICTLDVRASEDHGCDPSIIEQSFDTKFPLNINDADIHPNMTSPPQEHEGATEMTFDLIRYSVSTTVRRLSYAPAGPSICRTKAAGLSLEDKERNIEELNQHIEKKYLRHCDTQNIPLHWVAATVARLIMAKMWLVVHHPLQHIDAGNNLPKETKDRLFSTSVEVIEFSRLLETEETTLKWGWLFRTYVQWHALAFVLSQLCVRTTGPDVDRAWIAIEACFDDWGGAVSGNQRGMLWKPLRKLMTKARTERAKALQKQARFPLDGSIGPVSGLNTQPGPDMNGSAQVGAFGNPAVGVSSNMFMAGIQDAPSNPTNTISSNVDGGSAPLTSMQTLPAFPTNTTSPANGIAGFDPQQQFIPKRESDLMNDIDSWNQDPALFTSQENPPMMLEDNVNWAGWE